MRIFVERGCCNLLTLVVYTSVLKAIYSYKIIVINSTIFQQMPVKLRHRTCNTGHPASIYKENDQDQDQIGAKKAYSSRRAALNSSGSNQVKSSTTKKPQSSKAQHALDDTAQEQTAVMRNDKKQAAGVNKQCCDKPEQSGPPVKLEEEVQGYNPPKKPKKRGRPPKHKTKEQLQQEQLQRMKQQYYRESETMHIVIPATQTCSAAIIEVNRKQYYEEQRRKEEEQRLLQELIKKQKQYQQKQLEPMEMTQQLEKQIVDLATLNMEELNGPSKIKDPFFLMKNYKNKFESLARKTYEEWMQLKQEKNFSFYTAKLNYEKNINEMQRRLQHKMRGQIEKKHERQVNEDNKFFSYFTNTYKEDNQIMDKMVRDMQGKFDSSTNQYWDPLVFGEEKLQKKLQKERAMMESRRTREHHQKKLKMKIGNTVQEHVIFKRLRPEETEEERRARKLKKHMRRQKMRMEGNSALTADVTSQKYSDMVSSHTEGRKRQMARPPRVFALQEVGRINQQFQPPEMKMADRPPGQQQNRFDYEKYKRDNPWDHSDEQNQKPAKRYTPPPPPAPSKKTEPSQKQTQSSVKKIQPRQPPKDQPQSKQIKHHVYRQPSYDYQQEDQQWSGYYRSVPKVKRLEILNRYHYNPFEATSGEDQCELWKRLMKDEVPDLDVHFDREKKDQKVIHHPHQKCILSNQDPEKALKVIQRDFYIENSYDPQRGTLKPREKKKIHKQSSNEEMKRKADIGRFLAKRKKQMNPYQNHDDTVELDDVEPPLDKAMGQDIYQEESEQNEVKQKIVQEKVIRISSDSTKQQTWAVKSQSSHRKRQFGIQNKEIVKIEEVNQAEQEQKQPQKQPQNQSAKDKTSVDYQKQTFQKSDPTKKGLNNAQK